MRLLWINENASLIGGCEQYILHTASLLRSYGVRSFLIYASKENVSKKFLAAFEGSLVIDHLRDGLEKFPHDLIYIHQLPSRGDWIKELQQQTTPVIRFFHDYHLFCLRGNKIIPFTNSPCNRVPSCRCYPLGISIRPKKTFPWFWIRTMEQLLKSQEENQQLDGYVVASEYVAKHVLKNGFDSDKLRMIPLYAMEKPPHATERDSTCILFVGQLIRGKGVDVAIRAIHRMGPPYTLIIAGEGKQQFQYEKLARRLQIDDRIFFLGQLSQRDLEKWYQKAACVVFPTRYPELFGLVGVEAMSFGTSVVASNVGAVSEWLEDGKTGYLVPPNNPEMLAKRALAICRDEALRSRLGKAARKRYEESFLPKYHLERLLNFFEERIEAKKKRNFYGKFTVYGSQGEEEKISNVIDEVKSTIQKEISSDSYRAILLIGGYGKGEGGIENGQLHNNLDFLVVSKGVYLSLRGNIQKILLPISNKYEIGFDISEVSEFQLKWSSPHLIWYEMVHGHKCLLGDRDFIKSLPFQKPEGIVETDFLDLMVNRGTLLIINRCLLDSRKKLDRNLRKVFIKHMMKAVIGFGDAYLALHGHYHWSYKERLERMKIHPAISQELKEKYVEAAEFRLQTHYDTYLEKDFEEWISSTEKFLSRIFLECERIHLKDPSISETSYCQKRLENVLWSNWLSLGGLSRKWQGLIHPPKVLIGETPSAKLGFYLLSPFERLSVVFPVVAFEMGDETFKKQVFGFFNSSDSWPNLRKAYLRNWAKFGDLNFSRSIKEWNLQIYPHFSQNLG